MKNVRSDSIRGYRIDPDCTTVYLNYTFASKALRDFLSPEAERLREIKAAFPSITVVVAAGRKITTARPTKRLTYKNMAAYIGTMANAEALLKQFETVKQQSKAQPSPYKYVRDWFERQFPDYRESKIFQEAAPKNDSSKGSNISPFPASDSTEETIPDAVNA